VLAPTAHFLLHDRSLENVSKQKFLRRVLKLLLEGVEKFVEEFLSISLLTCVSRLAIKLLKGEAELSRVDHGALTLLQHAEEHLELSKHVIIDHALFVLLHVRRGFIRDLEKSIAEGGHPVELLQHRNHVAYVAEVANAELLVLTANTIGWLVVPALRPGHSLDHRLEHVAEEATHIARSQELQNLEQQLEGGFARLRALRLVSAGALGLLGDEEEHLIEDVLDQLLFAQKPQHLIVCFLLVQEAENIGSCQEKRFEGLSQTQVLLLLLIKAIVTFDHADESDDDVSVCVLDFLGWPTLMSVFSFNVILL